ncbi:MAG: transglycosylase domain-containing protein [Proteobacteria bacterium]|nr:transglycosylase domain-containing protein [Pseudomonadota bacterium]
MGIKRLLTTFIVVAFTLGLVIVLLFQAGADEQVLKTILPRLEKRLGINITYRQVDASLTSFVIEDVEILTLSGENLFAAIDRLRVGIRVGPLLLGDLDITGIRLDGLQIRIGSEVQGASISDWIKLRKRLGKNKPGKGSSQESSIPEIHIASGKIVFNDGRFAAHVGGIAGRIGSNRQTALAMANFMLKHGNQRLVQGTDAELQYFTENRGIAIHSKKPAFELPASGEQILSLLRDGQTSLNQLLNLIKENEPGPGSEINGRKKLDSQKTIGELKLVMAEASAVLVDPGTPPKQVSIDDITIDVAKTESGPLFIRASGKSPGTDARWTLGSKIPPDGNPSVTVEVPDMSLAKIGDLFSASEHVEWKQAFADGAITAELASSGQKVTVSGQTAISGVTLKHSRLAIDPIEDFSAHGEFKVTYDRQEGMLHLERFQISRGLARVTIRGDIRLDRLAFDLYVHVPPAACKQIMGAFPKVFRSRLQGVQLDGQIGLDLHLAVDNQKPDDTLLEADLDNRCRITEFGGLPEPNYFRGPFTYVAYTGEGEDLRLVTGQGTDRWTPLAMISPFVIEAVLTTEDGKFWRHSGLTIPEVRRAIELNIKKESLKHGASTITMQLAKNLFLTRDRSVARKLQELFLVWYLESNFQKEEILELYLNIVEFGPSIYGIRDAAEHYFGRSPAELNTLESVFLIKLLPNPVARHKSYVRGKISDRQVTNLHRVLETMKKRERITEAELAEALKQEIKFHKEGDPIPEPRPPVKRLDTDQLSPNEEIEIDPGATELEEPTWNEAP